MSNRVKVPRTWQYVFTNLMFEGFLATRENLMGSNEKKRTSRQVIKPNEVFPFDCSSILKIERSSNELLLSKWFQFFLRPRK